MCVCVCVCVEGGGGTLKIKEFAHIGSKFFSLKVAPIIKEETILCWAISLLQLHFIMHVPGVCNGRYTTITGHSLDSTSSAAL